MLRRVLDDTIFTPDLSAIDTVIDEIADSSAAIDPPADSEGDFDADCEPKKISEASSSTDYPQVRRRKLQNQPNADEPNPADDETTKDTPGQIVISSKRPPSFSE